MKSPENVKLIKDWLSFARENLLFAKDFRLITLFVSCVREVQKNT